MRDLEQARALLEAVRRDLGALRGMQDAATFADEIFGLHVQPAAEKGLKAWLALEGVVYPRTHDLSRLLNVLTEREAEVAPFQDLIEYNPYAVQLRYETFDSDAESLDREQAIQRSGSFRDHVRRLLDEVEGA